jgi:hypothetical protein
VSAGALPAAVAERAALRLRGGELIAALVLLALGAAVVVDSLRLGRGWGDAGPQDGCFPFYVGLLICGASLVNAVRALGLRGPRNPVLIESRAAWLVLCVLVPTALYAASIGWLGIYVASALFVGLFMRCLGSYASWQAAAVGTANSVFFFAIFERWFQVPLPKGPLEAWLGLA